VRLHFLLGAPVSTAKMYDRTKLTPGGTRTVACRFEAPEPATVVRSMRSGNAANWSVSSGCASSEATTPRLKQHLDDEIAWHERFEIYQGPQTE
jgi:hypothetical protein